MNLGKAYLELRKIYNNRKKEVLATFNISQKLEPSLPKGWTISYVNGGWHGCLISVFSSTESSGQDRFVETRLIRGYLKNMFPNKEWKITPWIEGEYLFAMQISEEIEMLTNYGKCSLRIEVRQMDTAGCKLTYEEKTVKVAKISEGCGALIESY